MESQDELDDFCFIVEDFQDDLLRERLFRKPSSPVIKSVCPHCGKEVFWYSDSSCLFPKERVEQYDFDSVIHTDVIDHVCSDDEVPF